MKRTIPAPVDVRTANELRHRAWLAAEETERVWGWGTAAGFDAVRITPFDLSGSLLIVARKPPAD